MLQAMHCVGHYERTQKEPAGAQHLKGDRHRDIITPHARIVAVRTLVDDTRGRIGIDCAVLAFRNVDQKGRIIVGAHRQGKLKKLNRTMFTPVRALAMSKVWSVEPYKL